jgi:hypothetical protein
VRKLPVLAVGGMAAALIGGTAIAAAQKTHRMEVALPDGSIAQIDYVGDVAPKVSVAPARVPEAAAAWAMPFPSFAGFDRMIEQMQRQSQEMVRQAQQVAQQPAGAPGVNVAAYGNLPAGQSSTTVVSYSNGGTSCTRTTQVVAQGPGKPPKVTTNVTGDCALIPPAATGPVSRT